MATGKNYDGFVVSVGDSVTIMGSASVVTGSGALATVTVLPLNTTSTISVIGTDCSSVDHDKDASHAAQGVFGTFYGAANRVSIPGVVTSISGADRAAILTVTVNSGASVTVPAASVRSVPSV